MRTRVLVAALAIGAQMAVGRDRERGWFGYR
jgi:hypothetical protein